MKDESIYMYAYIPPKKNINMLIEVNQGREGMGWVMGVWNFTATHIEGYINMAIK